MEGERWAIIAREIDKLEAVWRRPRVQHSDATVVRVFEWAALHNQTVRWACAPEHWPPRERHWVKPSEATMSRRLRSLSVLLFWAALESALRERLPRPPLGLVRSVDGKPLVVGSCSKDKDAKTGRAGRFKARGYKLVAVRRGDELEAWTIGPMNLSEPAAAAGLLDRVGGAGYLLGDALYDSNDLAQRAAARGLQLISPRKKPGRGLGHRRHSPHRLRSIELLESDADGFGREVYKLRARIERGFGNLCGPAEGLQPLPSFVRRPRRVARWVLAKIILEYAHVLCRSGVAA
jgi:hypothetical protein